MSDLTTPQPPRRVTGMGNTFGAFAYGEYLGTFETEQLAHAAIDAIYGPAPDLAKAPRPKRPHLRDHPLLKRQKP